MATNDVFTLEELREFVEEAGDFHAPAFSDKLKDKWINAGISAWADWVFQLDDTRFLKEGVIAVTSGTSSYDLKDSAILSADDYYRARGVAVEDSGSQSGYSRIRKFEFSQRHDFSYSGDRLEAKWDVQGDLLHIWPKPTSSYSALLEYFPLQPKLVGIYDEVDLRNHVGFVVTYACMHLCPRDESSLKDWRALHEMARNEISTASPQNRGEPKSAVSVYGSRRSTEQRRLARMP